MISLARRTLATLKVNERELDMTCRINLHDRRNYHNLENRLEAHKWGTEIYTCIRLGIETGGNKWE